MNWDGNLIKLCVSFSFWGRVAFFFYVSRRHLQWVDPNDYAFQRVTLHLFSKVMTCFLCCQWKPFHFFLREEDFLKNIFTFNYKRNIRILYSCLTFISSVIVKKEYGMTILVVSLVLDTVGSYLNFQWVESKL